MTYLDLLGEVRVQPNLRVQQKNNIIKTIIDFNGYGKATRKKKSNLNIRIEINVISLILIGPAQLCTTAYTCLIIRLEILTPPRGTCFVNRMLH